VANTAGANGVLALFSEKQPQNTFRIHVFIEAD